LTYQLLDVVAFIHSKLIAHLDIKPDNLVVDTSAREILLIDFGLSVRLPNKEATLKGARGTPGWVAPELNLQGSLDSDVVFSPILADTWAVGKVIK
ncbi:kinase-like protein, partial [Serendipita vermifera]